MPRLLVVACFLLLYTYVLNGQVYHFETGKVIPVKEPNQIFWKQGIYQNYPADYGTLVVKENRNKRNSSIINIPIIRIRATNTDTTLSPVFLLNGGPGESNIQSQLFFKDIAVNRDIVIVGYRGVDGSIKLDCPCMDSVFFNDSINIENADEMINKSFETCVDEWEKQRIDICGYSMDEVVDDIEITREILGYDQLCFLSFSYGTMLSQLYHLKYTDQVEKMVLIGARPLNNFLFDDNQINNKIFQFYNYYFNITDSNQDSMQSVLSNVDNMLNVIVKKNSDELNYFRFLFFGFSKLYTVKGIEQIFDAYMDAVNDDNYENIIKKYNDFYANYNGNPVLGDILLKKQGRVSFEKTQPKTTIGYKVASIVNSWYTPNNKLLTNLKQEYTKVENDSTEVLFIFGEFDVASPSYLFDNNSFNYANSSKIVIPESGHLDLFYTNKEIVKELLEEYFSDDKNQKN